MPIGDRINNVEIAYPNTTGGWVPTDTTSLSNNWVTYPYAYASEAQVAELRGKIEVLEKMVAALLSGRAPARKRSK